MCDPVSAIALSVPLLIGGAATMADDAKEQQRKLLANLPKPPQAPKSPQSPDFYRRLNARQPATLLTGPQGVDPGGLNLGKTKLLGG